MRRMSGGEKAGLALAAGTIAVLAMRGDANAATGVGGGGVSTTVYPIIVPEANLPQTAVNWYDQALTQLGFAGTFSDRLMGFQRTRMPGVLAPELSHMTPATQQAIQNAIRAQETAAASTSTGDLDIPAGARRMRY